MDNYQEYENFRSDGMCELFTWLPKSQASEERTQT